MGQKWSKEQHEKFKATMAAKKKSGWHRPGSNNGHVTAAQLLEKFRIQRDFLNDIISAVEAMMEEK